MNAKSLRQNGAEACTGCALCVLPCPVWRRSHDVMLSMHGRMRSLQMGARPSDLVETLDACLLCGACEAVCPEDIGLTNILLEKRQQNIEGGLSALPRADVDDDSLHPGEVLLKKPAVRKALSPKDLLVIDARPYHAEFGRRVLFYDKLKKETGCQLNLDLQRAAIPTGAASLQAQLGMEGLELESQAAWLLKGREIERVVVENPADRPVLEKVSGVEVVLLNELAP